MDPRVQAVIDAKRQEFNEKETAMIQQKISILKAEKDRILIENGLVQKIYAPNNQVSFEYPHTEFNATQQIVMAYKIVPIDISDEDFNELLDVLKQNHSFDEDTNTQGSQNRVASLLFAISIITYILCGIGAIVLLVLGITEDELLLIGVPCALVVGFISGSMFLGFAEIIKLLTAIKNKE